MSELTEAELEEGKADFPSPQADAGEIVKRLRKGRSANEWVSEELALNAASLIERQATRIKELGLVATITGAIASAYAKGLEDAAKIAEDYPKRQNPDGEYVPTAAVNMCWREIAAAIRGPLTRAPSPQADAGEIEELRERYYGKGRHDAAFDASLSLIERQAARIETLEKMDREAATYVESVICMRTHFTGEPPYVGWKGLGLALSETLDQYEQSKAEIERQAAEIAYWKEQATELGRTRQRNEAEIERLREALEDMATDERKKYSPGWFIAVARDTLSTTGSEE